ncbi:hypothetical protein C772_02085 [Bhargavaea cecembensis DSE10]|uniref:Uncharacterized protein n=1 Tax=Bhargavaea cecembensis DSE10 TaxID=1235279 RepID=M7P5K9_9BACL|nr:hypothetical protein C772_02085 [Bhargavaea cecembensis DSE10]
MKKGEANVTLFWLIEAEGPRHLREKPDRRDPQDAVAGLGGGPRLARACSEINPFTIGSKQENTYFNLLHVIASYKIVTFSRNPL